MSDIFPADSDGDALRRVAGSGADMSRPMVIEFSLDVPDQPAAHPVAELVAPLGFDANVSFDEDHKRAACYDF
jgi:Regulator of ribonuclease activity B